MDECCIAWIYYLFGESNPSVLDTFPVKDIKYKRNNKTHWYFSAKNFSVRTPKAHRVGVFHGFIRLILGPVSRIDAFSGSRDAT